MQINAKLRGKLPPVEDPAPFASPDGRFRGWKVTFPGRHPLATPAVADGRVFLGGGFGSYDFFALDAATGRLAWQYQTSDDGPTAAVVEDGFVAFNTESCELEVLTVAGKPVWKKWLGDPLMSVPAAEGGRIYMAYPDSKGDRRHYLACFGLETGEELWRQPIKGEIITAPVLAESRVYLATLDGTLACFRKEDGEPLWQEPRNATSSPLVREGRCYFSQRQEVTLAEAGRQGIQQTEHVAWSGVEAGAPTSSFRATSRAADYLDHEKRQRRSPRYAESAQADAFVGFAAHKGDAKMHMAMTNLGHAHVHGVWAYQGSKPFLSAGRLYSSQGDVLNCAEPRSEEVLWKRAFGESAGQGELLDHVLTPPALVNGKVFLGTVTGAVHCLSAGTGEELWSVPLGEPVVFQPAVAGGRVYAATGAGTLYCLETGDPGDDGWRMWGADAAHNGLPD